VRSLSLAAAAAANARFLSSPATSTPPGILTASLPSLMFETEFRKPNLKLFVAY
jgi:hypothetical protein